MAVTLSEPAAPPRSGLDRGSLVGRYVILQQVGVGAFGKVYAAYDPDLDRKVALKLMKSRINELGSAKSQLLREAQAMAKLSHENVVTVFGFGEFEGDVYISMEYVHGPNLKQWFAQAPRGWQEVRDVMLAAGRGLAAAHAAGIMHGDFKPHNVLIDDRGRATVADFGLAGALEELSPIRESDTKQMRPLAKRASAESPIRGNPGRNSDLGPTDRGRVVGSPAYMAPEKFALAVVDERSDQFSFCVALFEGLYGRRPFAGDTFKELSDAVRSGKVRFPDSASGVPSWVSEVVRRGLSTEPHDRFTSMDELLGALAAEPGAKRTDHRALTVTALVSACVAVLLTGALTTVLRSGATVDELNVIDALEVEAKAAAAENYFVHPPVENPTYATAYLKVKELEELDGGYDPDADDRAVELRREFAGTLARLGDYYWDADYGKSFAIDYYSQVLVFDPDHARASGRGALTLGQLEDLRRKAEAGEFSHGELVAAEPLAVLATEEIEQRSKRLRELVANPVRHRSTISREGLALVADITEAMAGGVVSAPPEAGFSQPLPRMTDAMVQGMYEKIRHVGQQASQAGVAHVVSLDKEKAVAAVKIGELAREDEKQPAEFPARVVTKRKSGSVRAATKLVGDGKKYLRRGRFDEASQLFFRALREDRRNAAALIGLSDIAFEQGQYQSAVEYGERGVAASPRTSHYRVVLGDAYQKTLRLAEAQEQYEIAARKGNRRAKRRLARLRRKLGE